ncbi:hypothetical protein [Methylobacterium sp. Leaf466]|uniref:hypothetical protein n=1 Tax=Methylobacterium sp. Leaf466 TaxID=1736386 RepID=UPI0006F34215|nr:hypothetical protein [Methylobacterium sp. Leaf466]KQT90357.1 hypothetical protein ASG59_00705 [Methylobacterium sp. Leaf466]
MVATFILFHNPAEYADGRRVHRSFVHFRSQIRKGSTTYQIIEMLMQETHHPLNTYKRRNAAEFWLWLRARKIDPLFTVSASRHEGMLLLITFLDDAQAFEWKMRWG